MAWLLGGLLSPAIAQEDPPAEGGDPERMGALMRIELPITAETSARVESFVTRVIAKAREQNQRPYLVFQFEVPEDQEQAAGGTEFSDALKLARFLSGEGLNVARTVAYIPKGLPGHAVLAAIACDEIMMPGGAVIGPVGARLEEIGPTERIAYTDIAGRRKTIPEKVALWLLDPSLQLWVVQTDAGRVYALADELEAIRADRTIEWQRKWYDPTDPEESIVSQRGVVNGEEAREWHLSSRKVTDRADVAKALNVPAESLEEDLALIGDLKAVRVDVKGPISPETVNQMQRVIQEQVQAEEVNFVCLWISSPGGSIEASSTLAAFLSSPAFDDVMTVAYVPSEALSDAALVALACDQVVMHPSAKLGGSGAYSFSDREIEETVDALSTPKGSWKLHSWSLPAAMIDRDLKVFRCERPGETGYFCDEERQQRNEALALKDPDARLWEAREEVTRPGVPFSTDGRRAVEYGLINRTVESFAEFKKHYGLQDDPKMVAPGWADILIDALASPGVAGLLLMIGGVALYAELHSPGIGVGAFVATVCFLLFFWSNYLGHTAGWLEAILFVAGLCCLLLEVFVLPGFGIFGLGGGMLILASLVLASQTFVLPDPNNTYQMQRLQRSLLTVAGAGGGIIAIAVLLRRWLPRAPIVSQMMLEPPEGEEAETIRHREELIDLHALVGRQGTATTQLTPSGKARFDDTLVDVITDGDVVDRGTRIEVVEVHGNRVLVQPVREG